MRAAVRKGDRGDERYLWLELRSALCAERRRRIAGNADAQPALGRFPGHKYRAAPPAGRAADRHHDRDGAGDQQHDQQEEQRDICDLITFLVVAITGSSLAGRAREQANAAARGASELAALYGFSQKISAEVDLERILPLVAQTVTQLLNVPACSVL